MNIVIISQNQAAYLSEMHEAVKGYPHIFVLDRCTDSSAAILTLLNENYILNRTGEGFLAGRMRNRGLEALGEIDDTLFLDGDRIPINFTDDIYQEAIKRFDITLARVKDDFRPAGTDFMLNGQHGQCNSHCFSCGMLIRKSAILKIQEFQGGHLFSPKFDMWEAGEDEFLGTVAYHLGLSCGFFPSRCYLGGESFKRTVNEPTRSYYYKLRKDLLCNDIR